MSVFCLQTIQNQCRSIQFWVGYILFGGVLFFPKIYSSIGSEQGQLLMACFCGLIVWLLVFRSNHSSKELNGGGANQSVAVKSELLMGFWLSLLMHLASFMSIWHCCLCQCTVVAGVLVHGKKPKPKCNCYFVKKCQICWGFDGILIVFLDAPSPWLQMNYYIKMRGHRSQWFHI